MTNKPSQNSNGNLEKINVENGSVLRENGSSDISFNGRPETLDTSEKIDPNVATLG